MTTIKKLTREVLRIKKLMRWYDRTLNSDWKDIKNPKYYLSRGQAMAMRRLLKVFFDLDFVIPFSQFKELRFSEEKPLRDRDCGKPVAVAPCGDEYGGRTYFGYMIGEMATSAGASVISTEPITVQVEFGGRNPMMFVPELGKVIYGYQSYWHYIESEAELKAITPEDINGVWYNRLLKHISEQESE